MGPEAAAGAGDAKVVSIPRTPSAETAAEAAPSSEATATSAPAETAAPPQPTEVAAPPQPTEAAVPSQSIADGGDEHLNTDDRQLLDWKGHYPDEAKREIRFEACVIAAILLFTFVGLLLTWRGTVFNLLSDGCATCTRETFDRYAYFYLGGQLGGILFGVKYLYKVVARGRWHLDRRLWRFFSPFLSGGLAFVVGALTDSGVMGLTAKGSSGSAYFSLGFIAGYFADSALAKMQEIADTVFGSPARRHQAPSQTKK